MFTTAYASKQGIKGRIAHAGQDRWTTRRTYRGCARSSGRPGAADQVLALDAAGGTGRRASGLQTCRMVSAPVETAYAHLCVTQH